MNTRHFPYMGSPVSVEKQEETLDDIIGGEAIQAEETFSPDSIIDPDTDYTVPLNNTIKPNTVPVADINGEIIPIDYTPGSNAITANVPYAIEPDDILTVKYTYQRPYSTGVDIELDSVPTATVLANGDVRVDVSLMNNSAETKPLHLILDMDGVIDDIVLSLGSGLTTYQKTYSGLIEGDHVFTLSGDLSVLIDPVTIPIRAAAWSYGTPTLSGSGNDRTLSVPLSNIGNASGLGAVYFQVDTSPLQRMEITVPGGMDAVINYTAYNLAAGAHTLKAFKSDGTTQIGTTQNLTIVLDQVAVEPVNLLFISQYNLFDMYNYPGRNPEPYAVKGMSVAYPGSWFSGGSYTGYYLALRAIVELDTSKITAAVGAILELWAGPDDGSDQFNYPVYLFESLATKPYSIVDAHNNYDNVTPLHYSQTQLTGTERHRTQIVLNNDGVALVNSRDTLSIMILDPNERYERDNRTGNSRISIRIDVRYSKLLLSY